MRGSIVVVVNETKPVVGRLSQLLYLNIVVREYCRYQTSLNSSNVLWNSIAACIELGNGLFNSARLSMQRGRLYPHPFVPSARSDWHELCSYHVRKDAYGVGPYECPPGPRAAGKRVVTPSRRPSTTSGQTRRSTEVCRRAHGFAIPYTESAARDSRKNILILLAQ